jgi:hypothetical protein
MVWRPGHPNARPNGYILEHRFLMSEHLGRPLHADEVVHHRNGDINDNRIENLEVLTAATHRAEHDPNINRRVIKEPKICVACGKPFISLMNYRRSKFCSISCRNAPGAHAFRRKLSLEDAAAIRDSVGIRAVELAARYKVSLTTIKRLRKR